MMKLCQLLFVLVILLLSQSLSSAEATAPGNLDFMCLNLQGYYFPYSQCQDIFLRDPKSPTATIPGLAVVIIDIVSANATSIQNKIATTLNATTDPSAKVLLQACAQFYSDGVKILNHARADATAKNFGASGAALNLYETTYPQGCLDAYANKGLDNPVGYESGQLITLSVFAKDAIEVVARTT